MKTCNESGLYERAKEAAEAVLARVSEVPRVAVVLGSGLGPIADGMADRVVIPYAEVPGFPVPTIAGHHGNLVAGSLGEARVLCLQGRFHFYEGHDLAGVTFPVRVLQRLGINGLVLTAAVGAINTEYRVGDIVCISDHLNLIGQNPLRGPNDDRIGPRFPEMTEVYSRRFRGVAREESERLGLSLREGVYACLPGPSYETPAEIRMLRTLGADVVGMSTVPEAIVARHAGLEVLAFAIVTNAAAGLSETGVSHDDVLEAGRQAVPALGRLIEAVIRRIGAG